MVTNGICMKVANLKNESWNHLGSTFCSIKRYHICSSGNVTRLCKVVILRSPTVQKWFDWWTKTPSRKMLKWLWNWLKRETCPWVAVPPPVCEIAMLRSKSGPMEGKGSFVHLHLQKPVQFPGSCFLHSSKVSNESLSLGQFSNCLIW